MNKKKSYIAPATMMTAVNTIQMLAASIDSITGDVHGGGGGSEDHDGSEFESKINISDPWE